MTEDLSFEDALAALEAKVADLSRGDVPLDRALAAFEDGRALYRRCHAILAEADQRVTRLVEAAGVLKEEPFAVG